VTGVDPVRDNGLAYSRTETAVRRAGVGKRMPSAVQLSHDQKPYLRLIPRLLSKHGWLDRGDWRNGMR